MTIPSTGCQTCRLRRIKCDATKPTCLRCVKSGRVCLKRRPKQAEPFLIHLENPYAAGQTKRPRGPRSALPLGRHLAVDLQTRARLFLVNEHFYSPPTQPSFSRSTSDNVTAWASQSGDHPLVDLAISSTALAIFSNAQHCSPAAGEASANYQQLLRIAWESIPALVTTNIDACLLAIFLMSRYEDAMHSHSVQRPDGSLRVSTKSFIHHDGAQVVLKYWVDHRRSNPDDPPPSEIIKHSRRGLIRSALLRYLPVPQWMGDGHVFGEHGVELDFDHILVRVANRRHRVASLLQHEAGRQDPDPALASTAQELHVEAINLDNALQHWATKLPNDWAYRRHFLVDCDPLPSRHFYSSVVYSYQSPVYAHIWLLYFATRMLVSSAHVSILQLLPGSTLDDKSGREWQLQQCLSTLSAMAGDMAATVPFCLERFVVERASSSSPSDPSVRLNKGEDVKPYSTKLIVWPLSIAACLGALDAKARAWFAAELSSLWRTTGSKLFENAGSERWILF